MFKTTGANLRRLTHILIIIFFACHCVGQSRFVDSLYLNVPLDASVKKTIYLLKDDTRFKLVELDTIPGISDHPYKADEVAYLVTGDICIPNKASKIIYSKRRCFVTVDNRHPKECRYWTSTLELNYRSARKMTRDFNHLIHNLGSKVNAAREAGIRDENLVLSGYEFYLTESMVCPTLSLHVHSKHKQIQISFN